MTHLETGTGNPCAGHRIANEELWWKSMVALGVDVILGTALAIGST